MNKQVYEARREKLRKAMRTQGIDVLLVSHAANRYYLSGFELHDVQLNESAGYLIVTASGKDWLCTDSRYYDAAKRLWDEERVFIYSVNAPAQINELIKDRIAGGAGGISCVGFESRAMTVDFFEKFNSGITVKKADGIVEELRIIKEPAEIERMERAVALNHKLMEWVPSVLVPGTTEKEVAWQIEKFFREGGASELSFSSIVGVNANGALPHYAPGDIAITDNSSVLIDVGCRLDDYCSDQTRTFWVGDKPTSEFSKALEQTKEAQKRAMDVMRPGLPVAEAYRVARAYFESQGVAAHFTHALGHGIGLETHEPPSLNPRSTAILRPGMIVTAEPGLYYPKWGGIRWEYMVLTQEDGIKIL